LVFHSTTFIIEMSEVCNVVLHNLCMSDIFLEVV
jgi:hypothetical protein